MCQQACDRAADCGVESLAFDSDNYRCDEGLCVYSGCNDDRECEETYRGAYTCRRTPQAVLPYCLQRCAGVADCAVDLPAFDADNYACEDGVCVYTGCRTDDECSVTMRGDYVCHAFGEGGLRACYERCERAADCAVENVGTSGEDNYACDEGVCRWLGCNDDLECEQTHRDPAYVCAPAPAFDDL